MRITYKVSPMVNDTELNALFVSAWPRHRPTRFRKLLQQALVYVCAYDGGRLVGFAKVVGDGGVHGFLLDPTVAPAHQRQGIGRKLIEKCAQAARRHGVEWLHVDFEPRLTQFYRACAFSPTRAGLRRL